MTCCRQVRSHSVPLPVCFPLLRNVAQLIAGRVDIAKRLKYTKDIMYRLINTQQK
jgi:hypothetical protein